MVKSNVAPSLFPDLPPVEKKLARKDHLTFKANREQGRHGWLRLTPAYSVHLVEELIAQCTPGDLILDPFCGTGTTALVAAQAGIPCHTVDVNPFLVWLANAKCAAYTSDEIATAEVSLHNAITALTEDQPAQEALWAPPIKDIGKWWDADTLAALARVFALIQQAPIPTRSRNLLRVIFCRVMIATAAVSFGHQSMSFKAPRAQTLTLFTESASERITSLLLRASADILQSPHDQSLSHATGQALLGDARDLASTLPERSYTTVITSPPYPNRMSYIRELRPYMYWLGYLTSGREAGELDWQAIGGTWGCATSNLTRWEPAIELAIPDPTFAETVRQITQRSHLLGTYVAKYFYDVMLHIRSLRGVLAKDARVYYIVGNSQFYGVTLPTERLYAAILRDQGFVEICATPLRKRTSKKDLYEYVVSARYAG
ncbi:MAG TPA: DNA methyltransferase [Ktedonobacterales bacterium]|nr:DNA methyltransferase [Ktedonobacterales bacterium]